MEVDVEVVVMEGVTGMEVEMTEVTTEAGLKEVEAAA